MVAPRIWLVTWVESGQNLGEGHPLWLALLALLFSHSTHRMPGQGGVERASWQVGNHCTVLWGLAEVPCGGGQNSRLSLGLEFWFSSGM